MRRTPRHPALWLAGALGLLLGGLQAADAPPRLAAGTVLQAAAGDGAAVGFLGGGTPVRILEERGDWLRVQAEGWIPAAALQAEVPAGPAPAGGSVPSPDTPPSGTTAGPVAGLPTAEALPGEAVLEGSVALAGRRGRHLPAADVQVLLLPGATSLVRADDDAQESERLAELEGQAEDLRRRAERAMAGPNFTLAVQEHDRLMAERESLLARRDQVLAALHGRREAAARLIAVAAARTDARGWYTFPSVAPGPYTLYARLVDGDRDVEWVGTVSVGPGRTRRDLGPGDARGTATP